MALWLEHVDLTQAGDHMALILPSQLPSQPPNIPMASLTERKREYGQVRQINHLLKGAFPTQAS